MDIYQAPTQMTDESGQSYPYTVDTLLDGALGAEGYYGAFVANMHTDTEPEPEADAIFSSATNRGVPIISSRQLLTWLDARNGSSISSINWSGNSETFSVQASASATGLQVMVPVPGGYQASAVTYNGSSLAYGSTWIKGIEYAWFPATTGVYQVSYVRGHDSAKRDRGSRLRVGPRGLARLPASWRPSVRRWPHRASTRPRSR